MFSHLAAVCVPAACDDVVIDLVEDEHGYRIRQPAAAPLAAAFSSPGNSNIPVRRPRCLVRTPSLSASVPRNEARWGSEFTGTLVCTWRDGYQPSPADAALIGLMVDHAIALVHRERMTNRVTELEDRAQHPIKHDDPESAHRLRRRGSDGAASCQPGAGHGPVSPHSATALTVTCRMSPTASCTPARHRNSALLSSPWARLRE